MYFVLNSFLNISKHKMKNSSTKNFKPACRSRALSFFRSRSLKFFPIIQKQKEKHYNWTTVNTIAIVYRYYSNWMQMQNKHEICCFIFISHSQTTKNSLSEIEKRERRAMERKLSELEEELKVITKVLTPYTQK